MESNKEYNLFIYDQKNNYFVPMGDAIVELQAETEGNPEEMTRMFANSFECTLTAKITGHVLRMITGTESNNERRMHHEPLRRRRK